LNMIGFFFNYLIVFSAIFLKLERLEKKSGGQA